MLHNMFYLQTQIINYETSTPIYRIMKTVNQTNIDVFYSQKLNTNQAYRNVLYYYYHISFVCNNTNMSNYCI